MGQTLSSQWPLNYDLEQEKILIKSIREKRGLSIPIGKSSQKEGNPEDEASSWWPVTFELWPITRETNPWGMSALEGHGLGRCVPDQCTSTRWSQGSGLGGSPARAAPCLSRVEGGCSSVGWLHGKSCLARFHWQWNKDTGSTVHRIHQHHRILGE